ncbi:MAG: hypothetical protein WC816_09075 [Sphingomonas sp.]
MNERNLAGQVSPPRWFWVVSAVLTLWGLAGVAAWYGHVSTGPATLAHMTDYDRRLFLTLPAWFAYDYAVATIGALAGGIALLLRLRRAWMLYLVSLVAVIVQFVWVFAATDLIAAKGAAATLPFPLFVFAMSVVSFGFARLASARGWLR